MSAYHNRSVENRLARRYMREDTVIAFYSLHGNYDAAWTYKTASRQTIIEDVSDIIHSGLAKDDLLLQFCGCLLAERYLRRLDARMSAQRRAA